MVTGINRTSIVSVNPANRQVIAEVAVSSLEEIKNTVAKARAAQAKWSKVPLKKRLALVEQFRRVLFESREELSKLITSETGKPRVESMVAEVFGVLETCVWLQKNAARILRPEKVSLNGMFLPGKRSYNVFEPLGVVAVISPWNYPFSIPVSTIAAALIAGNGVVFKPSPKTAVIAQFAVDLFRRAGFPVDLVGLVQGDKDEAEALILSDIQRVMFTGSVGGGKAIMALASKKLLPVTLELGGKHAAIVLEDSDVEAIVRPLVWAAFTNAGQACASIERLYVARPIAAQLSARIAELTRQLRLGDGLLPDTDVGPLVDQVQLQRVEEQVKDALAQNAKLLAGGRARSDLGGYFFEPTVLGGVTPQMRVLTEEIFGPVLPIVEFDDEQEAIALANDSHLGLGASIWTRDLARGQRLARQVEAGMVWINDGLYTHIAPDAPWGGIKESGFGRMHSAAELRDLVYIKNIGVSQQAPQPWNFPYGQATLDFIRGGVEFTHHQQIPGKLRGLKKVISAWLANYTKR